MGAWRGCGAGRVLGAASKYRPDHDARLVRPCRLRGRPAPLAARGAGAAVRSQRCPPGGSRHRLHRRRPVLSPGRRPEAAARVHGVRGAGSRPRQQPADRAAAGEVVMRAVMGGNGRYWAGVIAAAAICGTAPDRPLPPGTAQSREVLLATTTSTRDAGLLDSLVPVFERTSGYNVKVIAVGSGQALEMGRRGDADVVLAHAPEAERVLVDSGYFISRRLVMHNDFLIVGH